MPPGSDDETGSPEAGLDRISALPDEIIHHVLGFLQAPEAVRTSLLARGWRHHWQSMRCLRFTVVGGPVLSAEWLNRFMSRLLLNLRAPLDVFDIYVEVEKCDDVTELEAYRWVHQAVSKFHARVLMVDLELAYELPSFGLAGKPLMSGHLARLELCYVLLKGRILDFSRCTVLEDLVLFTCDIGVKKISSPSVKCLRIENCDFCKRGLGTRISAPNLILLKLDGNVGTDPVLESMPLLETAFVSLHCNHHGYSCRKGDSGDCCGLCEACTDNHSGGRCMLPHGLSSATNLELMVPFAKFTDLKGYPTFSKLKALLLNEWCVAADLHALIHILQHSPILEKLPIQLNKECKNTTELEGNHHPMEQLSAVSARLKLVKIKCFDNDERVSKLSELFSAFGIPVKIG